MADAPKGDIWSWTNWVDSPGALMQASGTVSGFPVHNLRDPRLGRIWRRSAGAETPFFECVLPVARPIRLIAVFGGNMQPDARFHLRLSAAAEGAYEMLDALIAPQIDRRRRQWLWRPEVDGGFADHEIEIRRIRIDPIDTTEIGRLWVGPADWAPEVGHILGSAMSAVDYGTKQITPISGTIITGPGSRRRSASPRYDAISTEEMLGPVSDMDLGAGTTGQVLFVPTPEVYDPARSMILGYLEAINPIVAAGWRRNTRDFTILETG